MTIALVQHASGNGAAPLTVSFSSNVTAGNCIVVCVTALTTGVTAVTIGGVADNFVSLIAEPGTGAGNSGWDSEIWADPNCTGGSKAVKVTTPGASTAVVDIFEFSGVQLSNILDKSAGTGQGTSGGSNWSSGSTTTTTVSGEIWIGLAGGEPASFAPTGPSSPWINEAVNSSANETQIAGYRIVSSTGVAVYSGTTSVNVNTQCMVVTIKCGIIINLSPVTISITANPVYGLIAAMAPVAGADLVGNAYASGFTGQITAFVPGTNPTVVETWHNLTPPAGWTGTLRYKILAETNFGIVDINLTGTTATGTVALGVLPAAYSPLANLFRPLVVGTAGTNAAADLQVASSGSLIAENFTTTSTIATIASTVMYPLDL